PAATEPPALLAVGRAFGYLLIGRHAGLLLYFPFVLPALGLFLLHGRRSAARWALAGVVLALTLAFAVELAALPFTPGGGAPDRATALLRMPGNRLLAALYPAFLLLVSRIAPRWPAFAGWGLAALTIGPLLFTPFGAPVADSTVHAHVRGRPLAIWPLELPWLARLPDYGRLEAVDGPIFYRRDEVDERGAQLGFLGGIASNAWLVRGAPLAAANLVLRNLAPDNEVRIALAGDERRLSFRDVPPRGVRESLRLVPRRPSKRLALAGGERLFYRLRVETARGARPRWRSGVRRGDYLGVELAYLGGDAYLEQDLYGAAWLGCGAPPEVRAGDVFQVLVRLANHSPNRWPATGAARVRLGSRWLAADGTVLGESLRTDLERPLDPGATLVQWQRVEAPRRPGRYVLELEPLFEGVSWFGDRQEGARCRLEVGVLPP
ncbi:MAG: hypothetical protein D6696_21370, partial [Acidobacteria bacterium]